MSRLKDLLNFLRRKPEDKEHTLTKILDEAGKAGKPGQLIIYWKGGKKVAYDNIPVFLPSDYVNIEAFTSTDVEKLNAFMLTLLRRK